MTECNVVRDLMPLVIDGAASAESAKIVAEHVAECEPCAEVYEELKGEIHAEALAREQAEFEKAAKQMQRRKRIRRMLAILLPLLAVVVVLVIGGLEINRLRMIYVPKEPDDFNVQLAQIAGTDQVVMLFTGVDGTGHSIHYDRTEEGMRYIVSALKSQLMFPGEEKGQESFMQYMGNCRLIDGHIIEEYKGTRTVLEVVLSDGETERVIYRDGDPIPVGSQGLMDYYNGWQSLRYKRTNETDEEFLNRREEVEKLKEFVPEFQTK